MVLPGGVVALSFPYGGYSGAGVGFVLVVAVLFSLSQVVFWKKSPTKYDFENEPPPDLNSAQFDLAAKPESSVPAPDLKPPTFEADDVNKEPK